MTVLDFPGRADHASPRPDFAVLTAEYDAALEASTAPDVLDDFREDIAKALRHLGRPGTPFDAALLDLMRGAFARGWVEHAAESAEHPVLANVVGITGDAHRPGGRR